MGKKFLFWFLSFFFLSCDKSIDEQARIDKQIKEILPKIHKNLGNDCLIVAINIDSAIKAKLILPEVGIYKMMAVSYYKPTDSKLYAHIILVFNYPKNNYKNFYAYDEKGARYFQGNLSLLSARVIAKVFFDTCIVKDAFFLDN